MMKQPDIKTFDDITKLIDSQKQRIKELEDALVEIINYDDFESEWDDAGQIAFNALNSNKHSSKNRSVTKQ